MARTSDARLFLITGATGSTGSPAVRILLERGHRVRAMVHKEDDRTQALQQAGAEVVVADLLDFSAVSAAVVGVTAAYFCYPIAPGLLEATANFAQAASEAGIEAVVNMSQMSARREAASHAAQQHWLAERLLDRTAMMVTHLRPTLFADWLSWSMTRSGGDGVYRLPFSGGSHAPVAAADQSRVIAAILEKPAPHAGQIYPLSGPVALTYHQIAEKVGRTLGFPVHFEPTDSDVFGARVSEMGASAHLVQHFDNIAVDYRNGVFATTNNLIEVITGVAPMTVEEYVTAHLSTLANK